MPLGPGALSLLLQPSHVQSPASGDGIFKAAQLDQNQKHQQWSQGQREKEFAENTRQFGIESGIAKGRFGLDIEKFNYERNEAERLESAKVYDELMDAEALQDPQKMLAAWQKAQARGIRIPGYEEKINSLYGDKPPPPTATEGGEPAPTEKKLSKTFAAQAEEDAAIDAGLEKVKAETGISGPLPGESIGDGWEVIETPESAKTEAPPEDMERSPFTGQPIELRDGVLRREDMRANPEQWQSEGVLRRDQMQADPMDPRWRNDGVLRPGMGGYSSPQSLAAPQGLAPPSGLAGGLPTAQPRPEVPPGSLPIYDKNGSQIGHVSPEAGIARSRTRVREGLSALVENARTPAEKRAAAIAMDTGQRLVGSMPVDKIIENAQTRYDKEMGNETANSVARGGKGVAGENERGGSPSFSEGTGTQKEDFQFNSAAERIVGRIQAQFDVKGMNKAVRAAQATIANAEAKTGPQNLAAVKHMLQATEGSRLSNQDVDMALQSGGALNSLHAKLMQYTAEGQLPPGYLNAVKAYVNILQSIQEETRADAYEEAMSVIEQSPLFDQLGPEDKAKWARYAAGYSSTSARMQREKPKAKGEASSKADDLMSED